MTSDHDDDGISLDLSPEEAESITLFLGGHVRDPKEPNVEALRHLLTQYVNARPSYHQRIAEARGTPSRNGPDGKRIHTDERAALNTLQDLAARWPKSLELSVRDGVALVTRQREAMSLAEFPLVKRASDR